VKDKIFFFLLFTDKVGAFLSELAEDKSSVGARVSLGYKSDQYMLFPLLF